MNASLLAVLLSALLSGFWLLGRRRPQPFLRSTDTEAVAALNRAQIERLQEGDPPLQPQTLQEGLAGGVEPSSDLPPVAVLLDDAAVAPARSVPQLRADAAAAVGDARAVQHDTAVGDGPAVLGVAPVPEAMPSPSPTAVPSPRAAILDEAVAAVADPSQGGAEAPAASAPPHTASGAATVAPTITARADAPPLPPAALALPSALPRPEGSSISAAQPRHPTVARLNRWAHGSRDQRLQAMAIAGQLHHRCVLPLLRRGLRDPDPAVMAAAAAAITRFRGRPSPADLAAVVPPAAGLGRAPLRRR